MTQRTLTTADGTTIAYETWGDESRSRAVVLHHGFGADRSFNWVLPGIVEALVGAGHRVVALDARGHGGSDKPQDVSRSGEDAMVRDLLALIDVLDVREIDLVGYSMGAVVALLTATADRRVTRLVVAGVGEGILECGGVDQRVLPTDELARALRTEDPADIQHPEARALRTLVDMTGGDREALAAHCEAVHTDPIPLSQITAPTLVLAGAHDPLAMRPERLAAAIPGACHAVVPGDHMGAVVSEEFRASLLSFLATH
jgi:pimeloyl-ACP methyl ester carboxylesterase